MMYLIFISLQLYSHLRSDQRAKWLTFFDEVDILQRLPAGPISESIWFPLTPENVQAYLNKIAPPRIVDDDQLGKKDIKLISNLL